MLAAVESATAAFRARMPSQQLHVHSHELCCVFKLSSKCVSVLL